MSSSNIKHASAADSASTPAARHNWTFEEYMEVNILTEECVNERQLIPIEIVPDVFADLHPTAKRFAYSTLRDHKSKKDDVNQAKALHRAWRTCGWAGVPYTKEDKELRDRIRNEVRETPSWKKHRAEVKRLTGDDGEECGMLKGADAEWAAANGSGIGEQDN